MPVTENLPVSWYETPNIHFCTIKDFTSLCDRLDITIERSVILGRDNRPTRLASADGIANFFGEQGVFMLRRNGKDE
jgi:methionine biosynthesis protein MetW